MIDWTKTSNLHSMNEDDCIIYFEKYPNSGKKVVRTCNGCGDSKEVVFNNANINLCSSCCRRGSCNPFYDKHHSLESKIEMGDQVKNNPIYKKPRKQYIRDKISTTKMGHEVSLETKIKIFCGHKGIAIEDFEGFSSNRPHLKPVSQCIKLNTKIEGLDGHHFLSGVILYIPRHLHRIAYGGIRHTYPHDNIEGLNMKEMNEIAFQFLLEGY